MLVVLRFMSIENGVLSVMISGGTMKLMLLAGRWGLKVPMTVIGHSVLVDPYYIRLSGWTMSPVQEVNPN